MYYARKSAQERAATGPYPLLHLLPRLSHPDFVKQAPGGGATGGGAGASRSQQQIVEKTEEFAFSDLAQFFIRVREAGEQ